MSVALEAGDRIELLHVVPTSVKDATLRKSVANDARLQLARLIESLRASCDAELHGEVVIGRPYEEIVARAESVRADLIVAGRHGHRAVRNLLIGTTIERVIRHGTIPVLVVNRPDTRAYARPLLTTDLGDAAVAVARELIRLVAEPVRAIPVLHASLLPVAATSHFAHPGDRVVELERAATTQMDRLVTRLVREHPATWVPLVRIGDPRNVILDEIAARNIDLVAVGTHGRSGVARMFVGSVAERVIAAAPCDVLVVRPLD